MKPEKTTMSVQEMGRILGLKKTDSYWLVHKQCFKTILVQEIMRVDIASFEHWYANQIKHQKVDGTPPGEELRAYSYSPKEMAEVLGVEEGIAYDIINRYHIETFEVDTWKRVRKDVFEAWYKSQTKYRTKEDRDRDAELEAASMTMPEMARLLGITRDEVYGILSRKKNQNAFDVIILADRKRVTKASFERWYQNQNHYKKVTVQVSGMREEVNTQRDSERIALLSSDRKSYTAKEAALLIGVSQRDIYKMIEDEVLDSIIIGKMIRIPRSTLEWWLSPQDGLFSKEVK